MIRFALCLIVSIITLGINGQTISVTSFKLLDSDLTANTAGTMEKDQNGETAALIKVVTTQTGFTFDGGALGIVKTKQTAGEVWVYVPHGAKKITIKHPQLGVLRDYYFNIPIESARAYEMVLTTGTVQTIVTPSANSQYLVLKVSPSNAVVELDNELLPIVDGIAQKFVKLGTYEYRVQAQNYHSSAGKVTVDNPNNKTVISVELKPAFGWIEIGKTEILEGAQVFIDNALVGVAPLKSKELPSGQHSIRIVKPLYSPYTQTVMVEDNQTTKITPSLSADYSTVTLKVANDAEIYINGEKKGISSWTGKLGSGTYLFEARKESHRGTSIQKDITASIPVQTINLETPTPIYGEINITSNPTFSDIVIDGVLVGQTPFYSSAVLIGKHVIVVKHKDHLDYESDLFVKENKATKMDVLLLEKNDTVPIKISSSEIACVYVDGQYIGADKVLSTSVTKGKHNIQCHIPQIGTFGGVFTIINADSVFEIDTKKRTIHQR